MIHILNELDSIFPTSQIVNCINLLPIQHRKLDIKIRLYKTPHALIRDIKRSGAFTKFSDYKIMLLNGRSNGFYNSENSMIGILVFNKEFQNDIQNLKGNILLVLFHEIQHAYQSKYKKRLYNISKRFHYDTQYIEKDADYFAMNQIVKNYNVIESILGEELYK